MAVRHSIPNELLEGPWILIRLIDSVQSKEGVLGGIHTEEGRLIEALPFTTLAVSPQH